MKATQATPRFIRYSVLGLGALMAAVLLCAGAARAQTCPVGIAPGGTQSFSQASSGSATPIGIGLPTNGTEYVGSGGIDNPAQNQMEAVALTVVGVGSSNSASAQINYQFCVQSSNQGDTVPAAISSQVGWNGILSVISAGTSANILPSASVTMTLVDLGTSGSASPIVVATATPLASQFATANFYNVIVAGVTGVTGSQSGVLTANVITGHVYQIQYNLDCEAPTPAGAAGADVTCYFGSDVLNPRQAFPNIFNSSTPVCSGGCFSQVSSVSVTLGQDIFGEMVALRQSVAANNLTMEQENAQILGILNEVKALLSTLQAAPSAAHTLKADPPNRSTSPAPPRRIIPQQ